MSNPFAGRFDEMMTAILGPPPSPLPATLRCADLFCGIGGFHVAARNLGLDVVYACDIDDAARDAYAANYGLRPDGDITKVRVDQIPDFDLLFAGFPCQPFSIIGRMQGLADPRGSMFFELLRFLRVKRPDGVILENVKQLATADNGKVMDRITSELASLGYRTDYRILNALDFGLPQKRERTIIVGTQQQVEFPWPSGNIPMTPLADILDTSPDAKHFASPEIRAKRHRAHTAEIKPAIWHENKGGNISSHPWSCALRAGASHNYLLVDGERRLTPREMLRLQGFPDNWEIVCKDAQTRKQAGNAVPVPMVQAVIERMVDIVRRPTPTQQRTERLRTASPGANTGLGVT
ncbi:MAG: DNA (cytosine-5-)-methyltransferase [Chloroflexota bacterium]|nr:DNA (cytosine-5-)-methyltransferase [Chloroflexota bacterium]MDE2683023.1 DNA (cytosine-5-)-methyltransferase [Chloroflexota bacterium]